jgi:nitronate monooxygenase
LGIRYPIVQGGLQWLSTPEFAAAVSNAGALGMLAAAMYKEEENFRTAIRRLKELTDQPFGVNLTLLPHLGLTERAMRHAEVLIEEGVRVVETSGRNPQDVVRVLKEGGVKVIHKVPSVRFARKAEEIGVDAVAVVGWECAGHPGTDEVGGLVLIPKVARSVSIPVIAAGGIATGAGLVAALALGAEGVLLGTRLMATEECPAHPRFKEWMVHAQETDTLLVGRKMGDPVRVLRNEVAEALKEEEEKGLAGEALNALMRQKIHPRALLAGKLEEATFTVGQAIGLIEEIAPVGEVIGRIVREAEEIVRRLSCSFTSQD